MPIAIIIFFVNLFFFILSPIALAKSHRPQDFLLDIEGKANEGQLIVKHYCSNCHASKPLINLGAPRINSDRDWRLRVQQDFALLFQHTDQGIHMMPARGGCFECTDYQLLLAILAIIPEKESKKIIKNHKEFIRNIRLKK
ncbi:MAG: c-type cytochrome [Legionella sp.]